MSTMEEIARLLQELEHDLSACARCGMCQAVCPLFRETGHEGDVARGKLAILDGLLENLFDDPKISKSLINRCLLCGSCATNCPNGVNALEIFLKARAIISSVAGLSPLRKRFLKRFLAHPKAFDRAVSWGRKLQKWAIKEESRIHGTFSLKFKSPLLSKRRHFIPLAPVPFHQRSFSAEKQQSATGPKVLFFTGCLIDNIFPQIAESALKVFQYHGIQAVTLGEQGCCGMPALAAGDADTMKQLIEYHISLFSDVAFDFLVTACPTCTHTIKNIWSMMAGAEQNETWDKILKVSESTRDISEFIVSEIGIDPMAERESNTTKGHKVTYHDPCHLKKSLKIIDEPRSLISANPNFRLVEMKNADYCCGMGGSFNLDHYELSGQIGNRKLGCIEETGSRVVATGCPACMIQLSDVLSKAASNITVKHPIEIYAESLDQTG